MERVVACSEAAPGLERGSAGRPGDRVRVLQNYCWHAERTESRYGKTPGRKGRRGKADRGPHRESGGKEGSKSRARAATEHDLVRPGGHLPAESDKKQAEAPPDPIADALAKDEAKKPEPKKADAKPPTPPKKPAPPAPKFDPKQVAALLDKRDSARLAAAGETLNNAPSLGLSNGAAAQLSLSELDALRARLAQLWTVPAGAKDPQELVVLIRIKLKPDGRLAAPPIVLTSGKSPLFMAARDSAIRALFRGQPYDMLKPEHYEQWKDVEITFDPRDMIRG